MSATIAQRETTWLQALVTGDPRVAISAELLAAALGQVPGFGALHSIRLGPTRAIIPAAGAATRYGGVKALAEGRVGRALLLRVLDVLAPFDPEPVVVINPATGPLLREAVAADGRHRPVWVVQRAQRGMGDAIMRARDVIGADPCDVVIAWSDMGSLRERSVFLTGAVHQALGSPMTLPTMWVDNPYVAVVRNRAGVPSGVLQSRLGDAMPAVGEADCGVFWNRSPEVFSLIEELDAAPRGGQELAFLPILNLLAAREGQQPVGVPIAEPGESRGVNTRPELELADQSWFSIRADEARELRAARTASDAADVLAVSTMAGGAGLIAATAARLGCPPGGLLAPLAPGKRGALGRPAAGGQAAGALSAGALSAGALPGGAGRPLVVFCGGTGTRAFALPLARELAPVTFIVNAYDDGHSTGRIRQRLGIVGPSDLAKLVGSLCADRPDIVAVLGHRLAAATAAAGQGELRGLFATVPGPAGDYFSAAAEAFTAAVASGEEPFEWHDTAVRNVVLVGAAQLEGGIQAALDRLGQLLELPAEIALAHDAPDHLMGVDVTGRVARDEFEVSYARTRGRLARVHIVGSPVTEEQARVIERPGDPDAASAAVMSLLPAGSGPSERARQRLAAARAVVYAPGTLLSSIVPTAMLLAPELLALEVPKVMVANLVQEDDRGTVAENLVAMWRCVTGSPSSAVPTLAQAARLVNQVVVDAGRPAGDGAAAGRGAPLPLGGPALSRLATVITARLADPDRVGIHQAAALIEVLASHTPASVTRPRP
ncbi:MAG TPA: 2-phospho-L-lactate transferase CofD family protein [Trebonia sp.]|nr:2-phospho-L-lactate transferase CofD family protein [Trebonia sp.]